MNYTNLAFRLFLSFVGTITYMLFSYNGSGDIILGILIFVITFLAISLWDWIVPNIFPREKITKEKDEVNHPVTQVETTLHIVNIQKHYGKNYNEKLVERCVCGSSLFRIYNEDTEKGTYIQLICAKCNQKSTGLEFNWKEAKI